MSNIENPIRQFQNCNRVANYRKLKVDNCHLKDKNTNIVVIIDQ